MTRTMIALATLAAATLGTAAYAGAPNNPGGLGKFLSDFAHTNGGLGDIANDPNEGRSHIPDGLNDARTDQDSRPNPANDHGHGND